MNYINKKLRNNRKGFTLIELIVVIAIIGILVLFATPKLLNNTIIAKEKHKLNDIKVVENALAIDMIRNNDEINGNPFTSEDFNAAVSEGKVYTFNGLVTETATIDFIDITGSKVVKDIKTKLKGIFIASNEGNIYYIDTKGKIIEATAGPETFICTDYNGTDYEFDGIGTITDYLGSEPDIFIPCKINGVEVTTLGAGAFFDKSLTSVVIPDSVTSIKAWAFEYNNLTSVVIPNSVTLIEDGAFFGANLTSITISNNIATIGPYVFEENNLNSIIIPSNITTIGAFAFSTSNLISVSIPDSVTLIGEGAFMGNNLTSVAIPVGVTVIENAAFRNNNLTSVIIPDGVTLIEDQAFLNNNLTSVIIPDGVTSIGAMAFRDNNLTSVIIPDSVTSIGANAFGFGGPTQPGVWVLDGGTWTEQ